MLASWLTISLTTLVIQLPQVFYSNSASCTKRLVSSTRQGVSLKWSHSSSSNMSDTPCRVEVTWQANKNVRARDCWDFLLPIRLLSQLRGEKCRQEDNKSSRHWERVSNSMSQLANETVWVRELALVSYDQATWTACWLAVLMQLVITEQLCA